MCQNGMESARAKKQAKDSASKENDAGRNTRKEKENANKKKESAGEERGECASSTKNGKSHYLSNFGKLLQLGVR
jgi:hypothetical protein